ncbi:MAG TPA: hypothetical protein DIW81_10270 [Planctomycetaceae bacterium]|nr:hypothetical protein [Rubinisphaera sp.]HCS51961.1 hypothetical protein [Planctomycetaceae bacterium]
MTSLIPLVFEKVFIVLSLPSCKAEFCFLFDSLLGDTLTAKTEAGRGHGFLKVECGKRKAGEGAVDSKIDFEFMCTICSGCFPDRIIVACIYREVGYGELGVFARSVFSPKN